MKTKLKHELKKKKEENYKPLATDQWARNYWLISLQISVPFNNKLCAYLYLCRCELSTVVGL
jgi:hypothetical protein